MNTKLDNLDELERRGLYIGEREDKFVENNLAEILDKKNLTVSELSRLTGVSRQYISQVIQLKIKPGVDFALKVAYVLGKSVEDIFKINTDYWYRAYNKNLDTPMYVNVLSLEIMDSKEVKKEIEGTGNEYYNKKTGEYLTEAQMLLYCNNTNTYFKKTSEDNSEVIRIYERLWERVVL